MADQFELALQARPADPKAISVTRSRFRQRLAKDQSVSECAVRIGIIIEACYLNAASGVAWPSLAALADSAGCSRRSAVSAIKQLVHAGHLVRQPGAATRSNRYTLDWSCLSQDDVNSSHQAVHEAPLKSHLSGVNKAALGNAASLRWGTLLPQDREAHFPRVGNAASHEPEEYNHNNEPLDGTCRSLGAEVPRAVEAYNAVARQNGLPVCQKVTRQRQVAIKARLEDAGGLDGWHAALEKLAASPYCIGQNDRGWRADIDFICRESKFARLMEGAYDQKKAGKSEYFSPSTGGSSDRVRAAAEVFEAIRNGGRA